MCALSPWKTSLGFISVHKGVLLDKCASPLPTPSLLLSLPVFPFHSQLTIISIIFLFFFFPTLTVSSFSWFQFSLFNFLFLSHFDLPPSFFTVLHAGSLSFLYLCSAFSNVRIWLLISLIKKQSIPLWQSTHSIPAMGSLATTWFIVSSLCFYHTLLGWLSHVFWRLFTSFWKLLDVSKRKKKSQTFDKVVRTDFIQ